MRKDERQGEAPPAGEIPVEVDGSNEKGLDPYRGRAQGAILGKEKEKGLNSEVEIGRLDERFNAMKESQEKFEQGIKEDFDQVHKRISKYGDETKLGIDRLGEKLEMVVLGLHKDVTAHGQNILSLETSQAKIEKDVKENRGRIWLLWGLGGAAGTAGLFASLTDTGSRLLGLVVALFAGG